MLEKLLEQLKITPAELINHSVLKSKQAFDEIDKFYQRINDQLNNPSFVNEMPREKHGYDHLVTHSKRVAFYSALIAKALKLPAKDFCEIVIAGILHDTEKIYWPMELLYGKTREELTTNDWKRIFEHPLATAIFVERLTRRQISQEVLIIIMQHHEDFDGRGYPKKMSGEDICLGARIIRVTDSYDSITSPRSYKTQIQSHEEAISEIKNKSGTTYDPKIVGLLEETLTYEKRMEIMRS